MIAQLKFAGLPKRMVAFGFDLMIIVGYALLLAALTLGLAAVSDRLGMAITWPDDPLRADLVALISLILPTVLYFALQESSPRRATWGKRKVGLQVVGPDGRQLTGKQAFLRSALKFLPWQIAHSSIFHVQGWPAAPAEPAPLVIVGFILVWLIVAAYLGALLLAKQHRTPYDWAAGSCVIVTGNVRDVQ